MSVLGGKLPVDALRESLGRVHGHRPYDLTFRADDTIPQGPLD